MSKKVNYSKTKLKNNHNIDLSTQGNNLHKIQKSYNTKFRKNLVFSFLEYYIYIYLG